jgi:hypothetical protein
MGYLRIITATEKLERYLHMIKIHVIIIPTHRINTTIPATQLKLGI